MNGRGGSNGLRPLVEKLDRLITADAARVVAGTFLFAWLASLLLGLAITFRGFTTLDTLEHIRQMHWLGAKFTGRAAVYDENIKWYGALWESLLLVLTWLLRGLHDVTWTRHAATFSLYPVTLLVVYRFLRRLGHGAGTALLAIALIVGMIRVGGHSVLNVKDFPFACGYALATLRLWVLVGRISAAPFTRTRDYALLVEAVVVSLIPYLLRPPVIAHYLALVGMVLVVAFSRRTPKGASARAMMALVTLGAGFVCFWVGQPALWESGLPGWWRSFNRFLSFPWIGQVRLFGKTLISNDLPSWYYPAWLTVGIEPVSLAVISVGLVCFIVFVLPASLKRPSVDRVLETPDLWLFAFAVAPWVYFLTVRPIVYDEDRHLLFAYPLLAILAAVGVARVATRGTPLLIALILLSSAWSYGSWGRYSYIYQSPVVRTGAPLQFMGDFWGVGMGAAARRMVDTVPDGAQVTVVSIAEPHLSGVLKAELERFNSNPLLRRASPVRYDVRENQVPPAGDVYFVVGSRMGDYRTFLDRLAGVAAARLVWQAVLPTGEPAAMLFRYRRP